MNEYRRPEVVEAQGDLAKVMVRSRCAQTLRNLEHSSRTREHPGKPLNCLLRDPGACSLVAVREDVAMPLLDGMRVVHSGIHGYGVITTREFKSGEVVCFGDGVLYQADDEFDDTYALILPRHDAEPDGEQVFWDLCCQTRWFNHSCDPNTDVLSRWDAEQNTVVAWWVALRDIPSGEEITYDYGFSAEVAEPCACGTRACRGVIIEDDVEEIARLPERLRPLLRAPERAAS